MTALPDPVPHLLLSAQPRAAPVLAKPAKAPRRKEAPAKAGADAKSARLAAAIDHLEARWREAAASHERRVAHDFAALRKGLRGKGGKAPANAAKLAKALALPKPGKGRLKDLRRAEDRLAKALDLL